MRRCVLKSDMFRANLELYQVYINPSPVIPLLFLPPPSASAAAVASALIPPAPAPSYWS